MMVKAIPEASDLSNGGTRPRRQHLVGSDQCTVNIRYHQPYLLLLFGLSSNSPLEHTLNKSAHLFSLLRTST